MNLTEATLNWITISFYALSSVLIVLGFVFDKELLKKGAILLVVCGWLSHAAALIYRWQISGHGPYMTSFEIFSSIIFTTLTLGLFLFWQRPRFLPVATILFPAIFLLLGASFMVSKETCELPPSLRSIWLMIHIFFAKLAVGSIIIASVLALLFIIKKRGNILKSLIKSLPSTDNIDELAYRFVVLAFIFLAIMIAAGAIWANNAWGRYWNWDPIETWALISWLVCGFYLHFRLQRGWRGRKSAYFILLALLFMIFTFFVVPYISASIHTGYMVR